MQSSLDSYLFPSEITQKCCFHLYNIVVSVNWLMADICSYSLKLIPGDYGMWIMLISGFGIYANFYISCNNFLKCNLHLKNYLTFEQLPWQSLKEYKNVSLSFLVCHLSFIQNIIIECPLRPRYSVQNWQLKI